MDDVTTSGNNEASVVSGAGVVGSEQWGLGWVSQNNPSIQCKRNLTFTLPVVWDGIAYAS